MRARFALAVVAMVAMIRAPRAYALCARPMERSEVLNDNATTPADGGLVVATSFGIADQATAPLTPKWTFKVGATDTKPVLKTLAPGLVVFILPPGATAAELNDGAATRGHVSRATTKAAPVAAPKVKAIKHTMVTAMRGNTNITTVTIIDGVPDDVIAMVVLDAKTGTARSFGTASPGSPTVNVYVQGRCSALPNNTTITKAGDRVVLRWVDKLGRLSPATKAIKVAKG